MQANWSLILNVLLLIGVVVAIGRLMKARRQSLCSERFFSDQETLEKSQNYSDDIIAVRKVSSEPVLGDNCIIKEDLHSAKKSSAISSPPRLLPQDEQEIELRNQPKARMDSEEASKTESSPTLMMFLLAKENRQFAGYELLQTVLTAGLRFGEGHLFHRHQSPDGQGPVLCSLAAATTTGIFDLQNIGAFSVRGLCLYMHSSKNPGIDLERFTIMLETARQLSEGLDAYLLDDQRKPLTEARLARYHRLLQVTPSQVDDMKLARSIA